MDLFSTKILSKRISGKTKKQTRHIRAEAYDKTKLSRFGMWDAKAAKK